MKLVTVLLPEAYLEGLDELVRANMYPSRSSVIRSSVRDLLKKELWENKRRQITAHYTPFIESRSKRAACAGLSELIISLPTIR